VDIGSRHRADETHCDKVYAILVEASAWLRRAGVGQWQPAYPRERFAREVASGLVWFWGDAREPMATVTLYETRPDYYPEGVWLDNTSAWYVCRLAVARKVARQRVGERVLDSLALDARAIGVRALRLDVTTTNPFLERYYITRGFRRHQLVSMFGEPSALLERQIELA
jgi:ribosomal protein S18 acetylase RimI-like enzyme